MRHRILYRDFGFAKALLLAFLILLAAMEAHASGQFLECFGTL